jgi:UDP-GlcNAc:undecaprenyl-phosphate GlcNAc-1-phosphate transferase
MGLAGVSFALSAMLCTVVRRIAPSVGFVDRPGGHKAHGKATPLGGGVAIWLTVAIVLGLGAGAVYLLPGRLPEAVAVHAEGLRQRHGELAGIMGLATIIMLMGLADDKKALSPWPRLAIQFALAIAFVAIWGRATLFLPHNPWFRLLTSAVTVVWIVGLTNAFNFLDNMDGLAASVGLIAAALFAVAQAAVGGLFVPAVLLVVVGALAGFLVHNWAPARLFMGDAGSNFLGFVLGTLTVAGTFTRPEEGSSRFGVFTPLLVMAVPLYDTLSVITIRLREGRSPFRPDRRHFSHRLVARGLAPPRAVATIDLVTLACGLGALLLPRLDAVGAAVVLAQVLCLLGVVAVLEVASNPAPNGAPNAGSRRLPERVGGG